MKQINRDQGIPQFPSERQKFRQSRRLMAMADSGFWLLGGMLPDAVNAIAISNAFSSPEDFSNPNS